MDLARASRHLPAKARAWLSSQHHQKPCLYRACTHAGTHPSGAWGMQWGHWQSTTAGGLSTAQKGRVRTLIFECVFFVVLDVFIASAFLWAFAAGFVSKGCGSVGETRQALAEQNASREQPAFLGLMWSHAYFYCCLEMYVIRQKNKKASLMTFFELTEKEVFAVLL